MDHLFLLWKLKPGKEMDSAYYDDVAYCYVIICKTEEFASNEFRKLYIRHRQLGYAIPGLRIVTCSPLGFC